MATYLLTGCAGFIGAKVAEFLLDDHHAVIGIDNLNDAYDVRLKHWRLAQLQGRPGFEFHHLDILNREGLEQLAASQQPIAAVINLAARAGVRYSVDNPWVYFESNVTGTLNLLELCRKHAIRKFVLASSSSLYGKDNTAPYREDQSTDRPLSPYAASKKAAEVLCHSYHHLYDIDISIPRFFTVYGPACRPDMSPFRFVQWISEGRPLILYGDGQQLRDFTYVDDIARGTIAALQPLGFEIINLGSDHPVMLSTMIAMIEEMVGKKALIERKPDQAADVRATWADVTKANSLLEWHPEVVFSKGMELLIDWYRSNHAWTRLISTD